ncbi:uncharacterized protein LOC118082199 isoform X9 [Zootoca vivipara]|uniref:uncharacterized protein LOC118082199 isoform X9 n=1 Tax=Zootoca vivipara TaxID=8524 RepID=UPI00293BC550|nr:uncharacterized protein LOC118082199 isoform X9 [Zootoca vivipara]
MHAEVAMVTVRPAQARVTNASVATSVFNFINYRNLSETWFAATVSSNTTGLLSALLVAFCTWEAATLLFLPGKMDEIYKISSTERVQQVEKELAVQLEELKTEIEGNGDLQGTRYCSVPLPKDVDYFRRERELALKKCLQVAEAKPLVIQADLMQRELEICLKREYTFESLPLLLHQFFTDRITQLVQSKYLHMLRWKRFCQHSSVIEQFYPLYQKQVAHIMQEYNDAVQRAARLSSARENFLAGRENPTNLVTQEDLAIYTQWLVCHLHSLKTIHSYLQVLQYLPVSHRIEINRHPVWGDGDKLKAVGKTVYLSPSIQLSIHSDTSAAGVYYCPLIGFQARGATCTLPQHTAEIEELKPQLRLLLSQFRISYDVEDLKHSADEMELFSMVMHEFRSLFRKQQTMRTFPVYDAGTPGSETWGIRDPNMALKKRANWIPFIKIKPHQDPWQQKMFRKLKHRKKVDELLQIQSKFLEVSNPERVMEVLQEQASAVLEPRSMTSAFSTFTPFNSQQYDQIWNKIYHNSRFHQEKTSDDVDNPTMATGEKDMGHPNFNKTSTFSRKKKDTSYTTTLQLLGLDEDMEADSKGLPMRKGAYLSLLLLRHLQIRELQRICLGILNYFRSVERTLTISTSGLALSAGHLVSTAEDSCWVNAAKGGRGAYGGLGSHPYVHYTPADYKVHSVQFMEFAEVENHDDFYTTEDMYVHTQDQRGAFVMYDVAIQDLRELEKQLLLVATQYIEAGKGHKACRDSSNSNYSAWAHASVDRSAVILDLWTCETAFLENKWQLLNSYFEAYQHALDSEERFALAQVVTDIMYRRPRFDFHLGYFVNIYKDECACLELHLQLVRGVLNKQIDNQREYNHRIWRDGPKGGTCEFGFPPYIIAKQLIAINNTPSALKNIYLLEFHPSLGLVSLVPKALGHILQEFQQSCRPKTAREAISLEKHVLQLALDTWLTMEQPESFYGSQIQKDLFTEVLVEDPGLVREIAMSALKSAEEGKQKQGNEKQDFILNIFSRLLELLTLRHRLIEAAVESAQLQRLYKEFAGEMGFDEFHLYLRPVHFEFATHKEKADQPSPIFVTSLLEHRDSSVDRYVPSSLMLNIHDIDNQIGKFSFRTRDSILQLLLKSHGIENLQIALACQVTHKNTLVVAVQQAAFCPMMQPSRTLDMKEGGLSLRSQSSSASRSSMVGTETEDQFLAAAPLVLHSIQHFAAGRSILKRPREAFVSIQLEKQGPRDMMLNTFIQKKQILGTRMQNPEEVEKVKREVIVEYCHKMTHRISQYSLRSQIIAYYNSLKSMLDDFPSVRDKYFMIGQPQEKKEKQELKEKPEDDPRSFQTRPRGLLSTDGQSFLNLWFIPHPSEVLSVFKMLPEKALLLFPWRTFLANTGPFPVIISNLDPISYNMQLCLCGLNDEDRKVAHGELVEMQLAMEDILWSNYEGLNGHGEQRTPFGKQNLAMTNEGSGKTSKALLELPDSVASSSSQKSYLILWKQLEILKAEWGRLKLKVDDINTVPLYKQFTEQYSTEVLYPAMRSIAIHMGKEDEFEGFGLTSHCILPPKDASETEIKTHQLQKLLESLEIHMIRDVQKKVNKEITLVISEKTREERNLSTELWKHHGMQEIFSVTRPEIVESFVQKLMENHQETDAEITFPKDHLQKCFTALGCDVMARERSNFESYSMFYENILRQQHQLLYQKEQEMHVVEDKRGNAELGLSQVAELSHEMIMEMMALRARIADLQGEAHGLRDKIKKEVQEDYEALVQNIFMICLQLKGRVDEYRLSMSQRMFDIISEVRREGVDKMIDLKKKYGSTKDNKTLKEHLAQQGHLQTLQDENNQLGVLLCKLKAMSCWKETVQKAHSSTTLREIEKEAIQNKKEYLKSKLMAEQEAILFQQQLRAARKAWADSQTENKRLKQQLDKQGHLLQEVEHRMNQEVHRKQQLDLIKTANLEKMLESLGERELRLQCLTEETERSSKIRQLQGEKVKKEIQQVRSQLTQERSLKLDAFQRIKELQHQLYNSEVAASQINSSAAVRRKSANTSHSASSINRSLSGSASWSQNTGISTFTLTKDFRQQLLVADSGGSSNIKPEKVQRPKTVPCGWRNSVIDVLLPALTENSSTSPVQFCGQKTSEK